MPLIARHLRILAPPAADRRDRARRARARPHRVERPHRRHEQDDVLQRPPSSASTCGNASFRDRGGPAGRARPRGSARLPRAEGLDREDRHDRQDGTDGQDRASPAPTGPAGALGLPGAAGRTGRAGCRLASPGRTGRRRTRSSSRDHRRLLAPETHAFTSVYQPAGRDLLPEPQPATGVSSSQHAGGGGVGRGELQQRRRRHPARRGLRAGRRNRKLLLERRVRGPDVLLGPRQHAQRRRRVLDHRPLSSEPARAAPARRARRPPPDPP